MNSRHARQPAGRPETGRKDARRIARPAGMGPPRPSFAPPPQIRARPELARARLLLARPGQGAAAAGEAAGGAPVKLPSAVHSMSGTKTARGILQAIAAGGRDPETPAAPARGGVRGGHAASGGPSAAWRSAATTPG